MLDSPVPPVDVATTPLSRDEIRERLSALVGQTVRYEVLLMLEDVDGIPIAVDVRVEDIALGGVVFDDEAADYV